MKKGLPQIAEALFLCEDYWIRTSDLLPVKEAL